MQTILTVTLDQDLSADERLRLKDALGSAVRASLQADIPVAVDNLGLPVKLNQIVRCSLCGASTLERVYHACAAPAY